MHDNSGTAEKCDPSLIANCLRCENSAKCFECDNGLVIIDGANLGKCNCASDEFKDSYGYC